MQKLDGLAICLPQAKRSAESMISSVPAAHPVHCRLRCLPLPSPLRNRIQRPKVTLLNTPADCVRWTGDRRSLLYYSIRRGVSNIWEPNRWRSTKQLTHFTSEIRAFDVSKDGKQLAIERDTSSSRTVS
jgi:hypothetical protein